MLILIPIYYFSAIFFPLYFTYTDNFLNTESCIMGLSWKSYYCFFGFMTLTIIIEGYLYKDILDRVGHLVPGLKISLGEGLLINMANWIKSTIINFKTFDYKYLLFITSFVMSQVARYDYFTDISFVIKCSI